MLRARLKAERKRAFASRKDAPLHAARNFIQNIPLPPGAVVALYHPIKEELDTAPLAEALAERGVALALPVVTRQGAGLDFRRYAPGADLVKGAYGASHPREEQPALPDIVVVPMLGFTRDGARLGYGGGYYDRTLAALRAQRPIVAIGYGYGAQQVDALPVSPHDQRLDWIVTERETIRTSGAGNGA